MVVNQTLLRCVAEEVDGSVLLQAINFVLSIGERLVETHAEGMRFLDEIVCQAMCLTQSAPNE